MRAMDLIIECDIGTKPTGKSLKFFKVDINYTSFSVI